MELDKTLGQNERRRVDKKITEWRSQDLDNWITVENLGFVVYSRLCNFPCRNLHIPLHFLKFVRASGRFSLSFFVKYIFYRIFILIETKQTNQLILLNVIELRKCVLLININIKRNKHLLIINIR